MALARTGVNIRSSFSVVITHCFLNAGFPLHLLTLLAALFVLTLNFIVYENKSKSIRKDGVSMQR